MIGYLRGRVHRKQPPYLLLDVRGVGYELEAPMTTFYALPEEGEEVSLHTHLVVREDAQLLFGFSDGRQKALFRSLLRVSGVGPKVALAILSTFATDDFALCIGSGDSASLTRVPGIGRKTAERLVIEMRDRLGSLEIAGGGAVGTVAGAEPNSPVQDAVSALVALGYRPADAGRAVREMAKEESSRDALIRGALRRLGGG